MEKVWLKSYPKGVPAEIDPSEFMSVGEVFERSCREFAERDAYVCMGKAITYAELDRLSAAFAAYLQSVLGLAPGSRVAAPTTGGRAYDSSALRIRFRAGVRIVATFQRPRTVHRTTRTSDTASRPTAIQTM